MVTTCPGEAEIEALAAGGLNEPRAGQVRAHADACPTCRVVLEEWQRHLSGATELRQVLRPDPLAPTRNMLPSAAAQFAETVRLAASRVEIIGYEILGEVHRGGQGIVYEAMQLSTNRPVAVKVLLEGPFAGERAKWRFEREVMLIAALKHDNIVVIHDSGIAHDRYYYVMDYVRGRPLDTHVRAARPLIHDLIRLFLPICDAVGYAHRRGVIHRDLKPSNIMVDEDGRPRVLDFGLAKIIGDDREEGGRGLATLSGQIMGTLRYMAPEQTLGQPDSIDVRTDVYALGVVLYELVTGNAPYPTDGDLAAAFKSIRESDPGRPSKLRREANSELDAIILRAMQKEPERRYQSAGALAEDLRCWLDGRPVTAKSDSAFYVLRKMAARHSFETAAVICLIATIIGFSISSYYLYRDKAQQVVKQEKTIQAFERSNQELQETMATASSNTGQGLLGWFLMEWREDRRDAARSIQALIPPESVEYASTAFLLDDSRSVEQFRLEYGPQAPPLSLFVIGERFLKVNKTDEARQAFTQYRSLYPRSQWLPLVEARLRQLEQRGSASRPTHTSSTGGLP